MPDGLRKFRISREGKELVEEIYYSLDSATNKMESMKAAIVEYSNEDDDADYLTGRFEKVYYFFGGFASRVKSVERFVGEQNYNYNGEDVRSLKFNSRHLMRMYNRYAPVFWWTEDYDGYVIFSKNIGLTYSWYKSSGKEIEHRLIRMEVLE